MCARSFTRLAITCSVRCVAIRALMEMESFALSRILGSDSVCVCVYDGVAKRIRPTKRQWRASCLAEKRVVWRFIKTNIFSFVLRSLRLLLLLFIPLSLFQCVIRNLFSLGLCLLRFFFDSAIIRTVYRWRKFLKMDLSLSIHHFVVALIP